MQQRVFPRGARAARLWKPESLLWRTTAAHSLVVACEDHQLDGRNIVKDRMVPVQQQERRRVPVARGQQFLQEVLGRPLVRCRSEVLRVQVLHLTLCGGLRQQ